MPLTLSHPAPAARWLWLATAGVAAACFVTLTLRPAHAQGRDNTAPRQKTESPYFFVKSDEPGLDQLPLKATKVDVRISGVIADVTVTQHYRNEGQRTIEAKYVFPGSTKAAVYGMNVRLADRLITANIREKQQARIEYDSAKKEGKTAALLEQHLPNVFQMNVANIMPGDDVKVELRYTELLVPQSGNYQFVFPTVVGPRYNSPQSEQSQAKWVAKPYLPAGQPSATAFDIKVQLATPIGLKEVRSNSHSIDVQKSQTTGSPATASSPASCSTRATPAAAKTSSSPWSSRPSRSRRKPSIRASTSLWSTSLAPCTASRWRHPRPCCAS